MITNEVSVINLDQLVSMTSHDFLTKMQICMLLMVVRLRGHGLLKKRGRSLSVITTLCPVLRMSWKVKM